MPKDSGERYYSISKLNFLFALVSIVLLVCIIAMFTDDYVREWKKYQKEFRELEIKKTSARLESETTQLKENAEYQTLLQKIKEANAQSASQKTESKKLESELNKLRARDNLNQKNYQFAKAGYDAAKYAYEEALARNAPDIKQKQEGLSRREEKLNKLRLLMEESKTTLDAQFTKIQQLWAAIKQFEKEKDTLAKQAELLERKLKKIDPKKMSLANKAADKIRDLPIMDFMNPNYRIEQVVLKDITDDVNFMRVPKVDRCITCHVSIAAPGFEDAPQPFRTHPKLDLFLSSKSAHPLEEFGCTSCHGGRGRGTSFTSAVHTPSSEKQREEWEKKHHWNEFHLWETPMLPMKHVEAGCFKCHSGQEVIKGAEKLNLGLNLIEKAGCFGCHVIEKYKDWPRVGPNLTHLASKTTEDWVYLWIEDPKSFRHNTWMPSFFGQSNNNDEMSLRRGQQEIHAIVHYLFEKSSKFEMEEVPVLGDAKRGEEMVASLGCFGCHDIQSKPASQPTTRQTLQREHGPNLIGLGTKTTQQWLYNWLKNPNRYHPQTRMPNLRLSAEEAADIAAFLTSDKNESLRKENVPPVDETVLNGIVNDFLMKMTTAADAKAQIQEMTLNEKLDFAGEKLIKHYGCFGCHVISGFENEKPIGTELTEEGSKSAHRLDFGFVDIEHTPKAWFIQKLKTPRIFDKDRVRAPDEKLKMPNFDFTDEEVEAIVTALLGFTKDKPAPSKMMPRTPENLFVEEGQRLVREFNCQGCHIIEGEGGAIQPSITKWLIDFDNRGETNAEAMTVSFSPPNLAGEGEKVQTQWLFDFIHNPTTIRPWLKVRMPTFGLNESEVNALVRYFSYLDKQDFPFVDKYEPALAPEELEAAQKLISPAYFDCLKCHIVGDQMPAGSPESWAPDFALAKTRLKPDWIIKWLKNPQDLLPGTKMPTFFDPASFDMSGPDDILKGDENAQIRVLRDYLLTLSTQTQGQSAVTKSADKDLSPHSPDF